MFEVTIKYIEGEDVTPEFNDDFVKENLTASYGWESADDVRDSIREDLRQSQIFQFIDVYKRQFLQSVLEFIILALCVFCALKVINRFKRKKAEEVVEAAAAAEPSKEETLLAEIRDLLKAQAETGK